MLCALIMAGGKGTRFWPLSTEQKPKQFLKLLGEKTMLQMTVDRIKPIIPIEKIFICTAEIYVNFVKEQIPDLPNKNIIVEPEGRNTAPCIALSACIIKRYYGDASMVVLPADHLINDEEAFINNIKKGEEFVKNNNEAIVTLGMSPTRPEVGYGYIKCSKIAKEYNNEIIKVDAFVEKPDKIKAEEYLKDKSYLWNGGIFIWHVDNILAQIKTHTSYIYEALHEIIEVKENVLQKLINDRYKAIKPISIDYAVLENSKDVYVIPSDIRWDDIGSWKAIERYAQEDGQGNILMGKIEALNSKDNFVLSENNSVILNDIDDIYVIECNNKILIGKRDKVEDIKNIKEIMKDL
ncbi:mannose-1-phosphate guanylyltransferase [Clostridium gasigenes]|uniref:mannose-1-phosphate guanylyltransferase n=1 Tax=Clostridium gasigenes TaxID=94869 RepID=UPI001C0DB796|nr:mannose-1-phosphate guanylyltransferase [Clostridium gasigenes]MBU3108873.1 mannose-1-phosphate guanylyltransferase [Clostridium gasigenes]